MTSFVDVVEVVVVVIAVVGFIVVEVQLLVIGFAVSQQEPKQAGLKTQIHLIEQSQVKRQ